MNRRGFFKSMSLGGAMIAMELWVPRLPVPQPTHFISGLIYHHKDYALPTWGPGGVKLNVGDSIYVAGEGVYTVKWKAPEIGS